MRIFWKSIACRIWLGVTVFLLAVLTAVNCIASVTYFDAIALVLGRSTTKIVGGETGYYRTDDGIETKADALENGNRVSKEICEEGFVLLKNDDGALPLSSGAKICVFGKNSVNMAVGGSGSGGGVQADKDIFDSLTAAGFTYNHTLVDFYNDNSLSGEGRSANPADLDSGAEVSALDIGETPVNDYPASVWNSCDDYKDAALIVFTRIAGEGFDLPRNEDGTHSLQLSVEERDLLGKVTSMDFRKVVVLLNAVTTMELKEVEDNEAVDAILWIGYTGGRGILALGETLNGSVTPSGRTVDTWAADFTNSPVWPNFGALGGDNYKRQASRGTSDEKVYFVDYEEGIYVGYRYYETAYAVSEESGGDYDFVYDDEVVYPFGYGLSYTAFEWKFVNEDQADGFSWDAGEPLTIEIEVTNVGDFAGRDVVQLYVTAPYYGRVEEDGTCVGIEKAAKVLVGFAKTKLLQRGESDTLELTVESPYEFASYDYNDANGNGFKGYEAEHGAYIFTVGTNAHDGVFTVKTELANDIRYETDPITGTKVENLYTDCDNASDTELGSVLSRADFAGTWPQSRSDEEKKVSADWIAKILNESETSVTNRPIPDGGYRMPVTGAKNGITLDMLVGKDYNDTLWDDFLDQLTVKEMAELMNKGAFHTEYNERLQIPQTISSDGPVGFVNFIGAPEVYGTCAYPSEVVLASTWNVERVYDMGRAVGNEALIGNENGDGAPYSGWYAPGLNLHRSPFGGRNYEYFSEDSFLSGMMTAAMVVGCAEKGVYATMKHFALNEQETYRAINGLLTWATEQSVREIYLKGFEIAVKTVNAYAESCGKVVPLAVMSSFNRIGECWTGGDYRLLQTILRGEWGFRGLVISDFNTCGHMIVKDMFYAGGDLNLEMAGWRTYSPDKNSAADVTVLREGTKNILYVVANSNAMRGQFVIVPPLWQIMLFVADGVIAVGLAVWGAAVTVKAFKRKDKAAGPKQGITV